MIKSKGFSEAVRSLYRPPISVFMRVDSTGCFDPGEFGYLFIRVLLDEFIDPHPASSYTDDEFSDLDSGVNTACSEEVPTIS